MFSFKRSVPILIGVFFLFASAFVVAPSAKQPCACVNLAPGESSEQADETSEDRSKTQQRQQSKESTPSKETPSKSESTGSAATIGESPEIKGFQGLPWGATPDMVIEKFGQPTFGKWKNYEQAWREWKDNGWSKSPSEVDGVLGWKPYKEGDIKKDGILWIGFADESGQKRMVWVYKLWNGLKEGNYDFIKRDQESKLNQFFGDPIEEGVKVHDHTPLSIPFNDDGDEFREGKRARRMEWNGTFGVARFMKDDDKDFLAVSFQSQKLHNARAPFPDEGKLSNLDLSAGKEESSVDTYGNKVSEMKDGRIDGFRGSPWGSSPQEVLNNSNLGKPKTRDGRKLAEEIGLNLPNEGKTVWVYEEEILGRPAAVWVAFENYHQPDQPGLIWTGTTWADMKDDDYNRIADELESILSNDYGDPSLEDEKRTDIESSMGFRKYSESSVWKDDYGRIYFHPNPRRENVVVQYQSNALVEKRESEVQEAGSKF